jgi:diguanylate cyclase (GGDEF)-like protein
MLQHKVEPMTEEPKHSTVTWETYRATLVNKTLHAFYLLGWIGLPLFVWRSIVVGWQPANTVTCLLVVAGMVFYRLGDKASTNLRGMVLVGTFFGLAIPGLLNIGVLSNGLLLIATGSICASLVFSRTVSLWLGGASVLFLSLVGVGYVTGALQLQTDANAFAISPATWITAVFVNFLSVLILVMRISSFRESLKSALIEVEQQRDVIAHQANHDQLTNLPTLRLANDRLEMALNNARRHGGKVALLFIDLDGFKLANDSFGHDAGDCVLQSVAQRIQHSIRAADTACRIGGDEFLVILGEIADQTSAAVAAQKIIELINQPIDFNGQPLQVGCSIGISLFPDNANDSKNLRKAADSAMYQVKRAGKNNFTFATTPAPGSSVTGVAG